MNKKMEINSRIICLLSDMNAPAWVRPAMVWDEKWLFSTYSVEDAVNEARVKIRMFIPRKEQK